MRTGWLECGVDPVSPVSPVPPAAPSPALSAFLRGIERRAFVFARAQCGDDRAAAVALSRAMRAFTSVTAVSPLSAWPAAFWSLLLAQNELSEGDAGVEQLRPLSSGPRAALLLRMVAGLDFPHAAQVLGIGEDTYRFALQRALQQLGDGGISYAALSALRERLHREVKTLPEDRTAALADLRAQALAPEPPEDTVEAPPPPRPWRRWLWALLALLLAAFAATWWPRAPVLAPGGSEGLPAEPLPPPRAQASDTDIVTHPDYAQLAAPDEEQVAADLALLAWLASQPDAPVAAPVADAAPLAEAAGAEPEVDDAP